MLQFMELGVLSKSLHIRYIEMIHFKRHCCLNMDQSSGIPRNFVWGGGSTNSVEDRGQREWGSGGSSP